MHFILFLMWFLKKWCNILHDSKTGCCSAWSECALSYPFMGRFRECPSLRSYALSLWYEGCWNYVMSNLFQKWIHRLTSIMAFMFLFKDALEKVLWLICPQAIWFSLSIPTRFNPWPLYISRNFICLLKQIWIIYNAILDLFS